LAGEQHKLTRLPALRLGSSRGRFERLSLMPRGRTSIALVDSQVRLREPSDRQMARR
jgi:hypothetical protein